ncbi:MAG TPA: hypothetical protein VGE28_09145 [Pseudomonas sp.]
MFDTQDRARPFHDRNLRTGFMKYRPEECIQSSSQNYNKMSTLIEQEQQRAAPP